MFVTRNFSVVIPRNWNDRTTDRTLLPKFAGQSAVVELLIVQEPPATPTKNVNDVTATINISEKDSVVDPTDFPDYLKSVSAAGARDLSDVMPMRCSGEMSTSITYDLDIDGTPGRAKDLLVTHAGTTYRITLSTAAATFSQHVRDFDAIVASLHWKH